jgi:hypothetical protein
VLENEKSEDTLMSDLKTVNPVRVEEATKMMKNKNTQVTMDL